MHGSTEYKISEQNVEISDIKQPSAHRWARRTPPKSRRREVVEAPLRTDSERNRLHIRKVPNRFRYLFFVRKFELISIIPFFVFSVTKSDKTGCEA